MKILLLAVLAVLTLAYILVWVPHLKRAWNTRAKGGPANNDPNFPAQIGVGFFTNFVDTLGIGSFATTSSIYKLLNAIPDDLIPGTMNVGHTLPAIVEAFIFIAVISVDFRTMASMIVSATLGAWLGAGTVSCWPTRKIQIGLGVSLCGAALLMLSSQLHMVPIGGNALGLSGTKFWIAVIANFAFGALQQLGVGLFAPCMIAVTMLGMNPRASFPIMMGSCAFLMPFGSYRFIKNRRYSPKAAAGLSVGGVPAVFLAAYLVKSLPLGVVRWLVVFVVLYTALSLLRSAAAGKAIKNTAGAARLSSEGSSA